MSMNYKLKSTILIPFNIFYSIWPKKEIEVMFRLKQKYKLNLKDPKTYCEKLNWQKLYYNNPLFSKCSDKYTVREFVEKRGCRENLNGLIWQGFDPEEIPFDTLPDKFVMKVTHGSGFNIICTDKSKLDIEEAKKKLKKWLKTKYLKCYGERWYGVEKPRIVVENFLSNNDGRPLFDYKFFCFDGVPRYLYVDTWKDGAHHINTYNADFELLKEVSMGYPLDLESDIRKPDNYKQLLEVARKLSKGFPHVRVDLYNINGDTVVFGEMTFSKGAGFDRIRPMEFDLEMGSYFHLQKEYKDED